MVDIARIESEGLSVLVGDLARSLEEPAVDEDVAIRRFQAVA